MGWIYGRVMGAHAVEQDCDSACPRATLLGATGSGRTPLCERKPFPPHFLFSHQQGMIFEKLRICSMPRFVRFVHDLVPLKEDPDVMVTDLYYGTIPVKLYQPKVSSCTLRPGIVFYHGGGAVMGSLSKSPSLRSPSVVGKSQSRVGGHLPSSKTGLSHHCPGVQSVSCYRTEHGQRGSGAQIGLAAKIWNVWISFWK